MKKVFNHQFIILLSVLISLASCKKDITTLSRTYKGRPLYHSSINSLFPQSSSFNLEQEMPRKLKSKLDSTVKTIFDAQQAAGLSVDIISSSFGRWELDTGFVSIPTNELVTEHTIFWWASVGKMITSTIIHQLIEENKLNYNDTLSHWFPEIEQSDHITIQHLLEHRSGIYSDFEQIPDNFMNDTTYKSPEEIVEESMSHSNLFPVGQYWSYSNTGYILLGLIIEEIESKNLTQSVYERISIPLGLTSFRGLEKREKPENLALAHNDLNEVVNSHYSSVFGAGNIVSNAKEMNDYIYHLFTGQLISQNSLEAMTEDFYPMFNDQTYYGKGIMIYDLSKSNATGELTPWIGHGGGTPFLRTIAVYIPSEEALAYQLIKTIRAYE